MSRMRWIAAALVVVAALVVGGFELQKSTEVPDYFAEWLSYEHEDRKFVHFYDINGCTVTRQVLTFEKGGKEFRKPSLHLPPVDTSEVNFGGVFPTDGTGKFAELTHNVNSQFFCIEGDLYLAVGMKRKWSTEFLPFSALIRLQ